MVFQVVTYECERWTIKKAEHWRIDVFQLWCWRRLLRVLWTARSNQSILKEISPEYSLEGLMLKLKLQYFGHLMRRTDAFELWCWRRLLRVPWTARRSSQSILKEISPEYSLEGLMLKLKLQYFGTWCKELTHWKRPWCSDRLKAGGEGDDREWDGWMASPTWWIWVWVSFGSWWWTGKPGMLQSMGSPRVGCNWTDWMTLELILKWKAIEDF